MCIRDSAARRQDPSPPDDFLTRLLKTEVEGRHLSDVAIRTQLVFLIISGNETTRHLIANLLTTLATQMCIRDSSYTSPID